jgi:hypothetical protein
MTDSTSYGRNFIAQINIFINSIEDMRLMRDRMVEEAGLAQSAADAMNAVGRADLTSTDFDNASAALQQIIFAFDSGTPTQKSYLYKML